MQTKSKLLGNSLRQSGMIIALLIITIGFGFITGGTLYRPMNVSNIFMQNSYGIILAIGMFFCMTTGGNVDLSVGSVAAFSGAVVGVLTIRHGFSTPAAVIVALIVGILIGVVQGGFIAYLSVPPFIATLAGELIFRGLTQVVLEGQSLSPFSNGFQYFANGFVFRNAKISGINVFCAGLLIVTVIALILSEIRKRQNKIKYGFPVPPVYLMALKLVFLIAVASFIIMSFSSYNGMPFITLVLIALALIYSFIANKTVIGRHVYMVGGNINAAKLSGVRTKRVMFLVYVNMAFLATIAGLVVAARLNVAEPKAGTGFELDAIAACTIGGAGSSSGTVVGAIIGAAVMAILNNGMSIMGIGTDMQQVIKGCILLLAVTYDQYLKTRASK